MRCPNCRELMVAQEASSHYGTKLQLFHCSSCQGIWLDRDGAFALSCDSALEAESDVEMDDIVTEPREVPLFCPRCEIYLSEQTGANMPEGLHIDYCTTCHGFFFDKGELMIYKTFLEKRRQESSKRLQEDQKKARQRRKDRERLEREMSIGVGRWSHPVTGRYGIAFELVRTLFRL